MNLIFFFETKSAGDKASMICVSFNIWYTSSLDATDRIRLLQSKLGFTKLRLG